MSLELSVDALIDMLADRIARRLAERAPPDTAYANEEEVVALVGSREKAKRLLKSGAIRGSLVGRRIVAERASLHAFLDSQRVEPHLKEKTEAETIEDSFAAAGLRIVSGGKR